MSMAELENVLLEAFEEPQQSEERERFRLTDENMANWALRKVAKARAEYEEAAKVAEAEVRRIDDWLNSRKRDLERTEEFFGGLLTGYYLPQHMENPRQKTFKLPAGQVQIRAQQPDYVRDEARLIAWLKGNDMAGYVEIVEKLRWGDLKKQLKQLGDKMLSPDGEVVDGILVVDRGLKVNIVTASGESEEV